MGAQGTLNDIDVAIQEEVKDLLRKRDRDLETMGKFLAPKGFIGKVELENRAGRARKRDEDLEVGSRHVEQHAALEAEQRT